MVYNMSAEKLTLTEDLAAMIKKLRQTHSKNGKKITAEQLSLAIGKNRAWMSQIESRRLKKIKKQDIIKIYMYLFEIDTSSAEERFKWDYRFYTEDISDCLSSFNDTLSSLYNTLSLSDKLKFKNTLNTLELGFECNFEDLALIFENFDFNLLKHLPTDAHQNIIEKFTNIKEEVSSFNTTFFLSRLNESANNINSFSESPNPQQLYNFCLLNYMNGLSYATYIIKRNLYINNEQKCIQEINHFIYSIKNFISYFFPEHQIILNTLKNESTISSDTNKLLDILQSFLDQILSINC